MAIGSIFLSCFFSLFQIIIYVLAGYIAGLKKLLKEKTSREISNILLNLFMPIHGIIETSFMADPENLEIFWLLVVSIVLSIWIGFFITKLLQYIFKLEQRNNTSFCLLSSLPSLGTLSLVLGRSFCFPGAPLENDPKCNKIQGFMLINYMLFQITLFVIGFNLINKDSNDTRAIEGKVAYIWHLVNNKFYDKKDHFVYYLFGKYFHKKIFALNKSNEFLKKNKIIMNLNHLNNKQTSINKENKIQEPNFESQNNNNNNNNNKNLNINPVWESNTAKIEKYQIYEYENHEEVLINENKNLNNNQVNNNKIENEFRKIIAFNNKDFCYRKDHHRKNYEDIPKEEQKNHSVQSYKDNHVPEEKSNDVYKGCLLNQSQNQSDKAAYYNPNLESNIPFNLNEKNFKVNNNPGINRAGDLKDSNLQVVNLNDINFNLEKTPKEDKTHKTEKYSEEKKLILFKESSDQDKCIEYIIYNILLQRPKTQINNLSELKIEENKKMILQNLNDNSHIFFNPYFNFNFSYIDYYLKAFNIAEENLNFEKNDLIDEFYVEKSEVMKNLFEFPARFPFAKNVEINRTTLLEINKIYEEFELKIKSSIKSDFIFEAASKKLSINTILTKIHSPAVLGTIIGLVIGISGMRNVLFSSNHYITNLVQGITIISAARVPLIYLSIGYAYANYQGFHLNLPLGKKHIIIGYLTRFAIMPFIGILWVWIMKEYYKGIIAESLVFRISIFMPFCLPSTQIIIVILKTFNFFVEETILLVLWQTLAGIICLPFLFALYFFVVGM